MAQIVRVVFRGPIGVALIAAWPVRIISRLLPEPDAYEQHGDDEGVVRKRVAL